MAATETTTELEALLRRWAELEPERCTLETRGDYMPTIVVIRLENLGPKGFPLTNANWYRAETQAAALLSAYLTAIEHQGQ